MNSSQFMDKQIMDLAGSSSTSGSAVGGGELFNLINPQEDLQRDGGSSNNGISVTKEEMLPSYDFQPIRAVGSGKHVSGTNLDGVARSRGSADSKLGLVSMRYSNILEPREQPKVSQEMARDAYDVAIVSEIDRTVKKYVDNILHTLEGVSSRLVQLESRTRHLETSVDELKSTAGNNNGSTNGKLRQLENILREVQTGVQVLRDKQDILDAQIQLSKLQQSSKQDQPSGPPPPPENSNEVVSQQAPAQPSFQPPIPAQPSYQPPPPPQPSYQPPPTAAAPPPQPSYQQPPQPQSSLSSAPPQSLLPPNTSPPQYRGQSPTNNYFPQGPPPAQPPPPSTQPPPHYHLPQYPPQMPPPHQQEESSPYMPPPQTYPQNIRPPFSNYGPQPADSSYPYNNGSPSHYSSSTMKHQLPFSNSPPLSRNSSSASNYSRLPTAKILPHAETPAGSGEGGSSGNRVPVDDVVDKVATMGFSREQVRTAVKKLTENGQSVDLNVVLDKLMNGGGSDMIQPQKGWFGR